MFRLFNTLNKKIEPFDSRARALAIFTCGPSVYQRSHIGNFRTFLFEDILVRYLEYLGYSVTRGMALTDVEDKAIQEAKARKMSLRQLTDENIQKFIQEMGLLRIKAPAILSRASDAIEEIVTIIERLIDRKIAYRHNGNIYFDPLKYPYFGEIYGLDMKRWPKKKQRFHKDTYPGMRWNLGDFILWHGEDKTGEVQWETRIGKGRPSWNVQDAGLVSKYFDKTLSFYCGGIDNLIRHHDYSRAILESVRPYPMARFWLHGEHLIVEGQKMSKSKGNTFYTDDVLNQGYSSQELRFFLIYCHYRNKLNYSGRAMGTAVGELRTLKKTIEEVGRKVRGEEEVDQTAAKQMKRVFSEKMDDDLGVKDAFKAVSALLSEAHSKELKPAAARGYIEALREIDNVLQVIF
jgi:cysteinyl-tRNA synthetase